MTLLLHRHLLSPNLPYLSHSQVINVRFLNQNLLHLMSYMSAVTSSFLLLLLSSSSGVQGMWLKSGVDIKPVPLLTSPDLDALCDPATPALLSASLPRSSPPSASSLSTFVFFSCPQPLLAVSPSAPPAPTSCCQSGIPANESNSVYFQHFLNAFSDLFIGLAFPSTPVYREREAAPPLTKQPIRAAQGSKVAITEKKAESASVR